jgi:hypothetical protein
VQLVSDVKLAWELARLRQLLWLTARQKLKLMFVLNAAVVCLRARQAQFLNSLLSHKSKKGCNKT